MTTRAQSKAATRAAILNAARTLFSAHGYEDVTVRVICTAAGKSTGALFASWPGGKDDVFRDAMGRRPIREATAARLIDGLRVIAASDGVTAPLMARFLVDTATGAAR